MTRARPPFGGSPLFRTVVLAAAIGLLLATPGSSYTLIRISSFADPPAFWPVANLPLPMRLNPAGSDNVPGDNSDLDAIIAGQRSWNQISTDYFVFAAPTIAGGTALNANDGINSIFFDEVGLLVPAGAIAVTVLNINAVTGVISDADLLFNGTLTFSTATPTPAGAFDIQSIATHELGHVTGLDHAGILSAVLFPIGADGEQFQRNLSPDDRLGDTFLYPEQAGGAGIAGLQAGDGDLVQAGGLISGTVQTSAGVPVPGAHVVALDADGAAVVSDVSRPDGTYLLTGLLPGNYQVYAEPLDGVTIEQDLSQSGHMNAFAPFVTTFLGGNASPATLAVTAGATNAGNFIDLGSLYGVETEANNTSGAANPVALEALTSGISNPAGDVDFFSFPGTSGDFISIDVDSSGDGAPFDPVITLISTDGATTIRTNDDFPGKGNDSRIVQRLAATGTFFLRVEDFSNLPGGPAPLGGPGFFYTAHTNKAVAEVESNNTSGSANPAAIGEYRGGIITSGDVDFYSFTAQFGDRIRAEVTANRAGSSLNPTLTLFASNGTTVLATSADIGPGNLDSLIDFTFTSGTPGTFYLRVTAASGAGANAFYVLNIATDSLNLIFSGIAPPGSGVVGAGADIFPKFVVQGASFDLLAVGEGIPLDPADTISVSGPSVSMAETAGPDFGTIGGSPATTPGAGLDFFAMTASVSASAPPGPRSIFLQNATLKAALSGGLVITPAGVPTETGPMAWSGDQITFPPDPAAGAWNVYRGSLPLVDLNLDDVADSYGSPFACGITAPLVADPETPPEGGGFYYLVAGKNSVGEGTLGFTRTNAGVGPERPKANLTATCP